MSLFVIVEIMETPFLTSSSSSKPIMMRADTRVGRWWWRGGKTIVDDEGVVVVGVGSMRNERESKNSACCCTSSNVSDARNFTVRDLAPTIKSTSTRRFQATDMGVKKKTMTSKT